ncbi:hypothetical protein Sme01_03790 [Sphaerisporangium melleum]|uniref:Uncharacterized protein n=1 Tax=Sphaerisporangium melleum TaxID=321316 RepID=A0A917QPM3_9ACTN|nr:hypothetical protein [Sphaerisporangium melleum]GGK61928.1 hypothetical protein GCM10007964_01340 [Sphaerisporangium melleum]GII67903.1 hypothetical protein Sme01_03790 [Sphaerisporangium melleum]
MSATTVAFIAPEQTAPNGGTKLAPSVTGQHNPRLFTSPSGVVYELVYVTPDLARGWLYHNTGNRPLRAEAVGKIARDMTAGRFLENGDAVRFSADNTLLDGQHRLEALYESGTSAWLLVVSNLPDAAQDTVDDGAKRTMADRFAFHGEPDAKTLASVVRRAILWTHNHKDQTGRFQPSALECFEFLAKHPELREAASAAAHHRKAKLLPASTIGLCWWLFGALDPVQRTEFFDRLADGAMLAKGHPILTLRNRIADLNAQPGRHSERHTLAMVIKSWNKYRAGQELTTLRFAENEKFPQPK